MSFIYNSTYPKVRQEGFHLNSGAAQPTGGQQSQQQQQQQQQQQSLGHLQPHPASTTFDPNSLYTTGALFADAFRNPSQSQDPFRRFDNPQQQQQQHQQQHQNSNTPASLDIHDELSYLNPSSTTRSVSGHSPQPPASASEHAAPGPYSSAHDNYPKPHDIFAVNQPHLASFSLPHNRAPFSRDAFATTTTPASLHHSYGRTDFFGHQTQQDHQRHHHDQLTPQQQQQQQQFGILNRPLSSAGDTAGIRSPLPDNFKPGGPQSPAVGPTRSRSRSRSKVSTSRTRVSKPPSLPPPDEPSGSSRGTSASRPSGIVIPGQGQHAFTSFGAQPNSTSWFVPGDQYSTAQNGDGINGNHTYSQSFPTGSLPMGASPTTQSGGSPPTATNDAATKLALANEKRRKRRESHNAVERRRRDNINEKIQELAMLLPDEWLSDSAKTGSMAGMLSGTVSGSIGGEEEAKEVKANKGVILRNSVEYIKNLVQLVQVQRTRNQQLESELAHYRNRFGNVTDGIPQTNGSGLADFDGLGGMAGSGNGLNSSNGDHNSVNMANGDDDAAMSVLLTNPLSPDADFDIKNMFPMQMGAHDTGGMGDQGQSSSIPMPLGMLVDTQSPSTPSGEGEDEEEYPRGRGRDRGSRFPSGAKKEEVNIVLS